MSNVLNNFLSRNNILTLTLLFSDSLSVVLAFFLAYFLRNKGIFRLFLDVVQPIEVYLQALPFAILALLIVFAFDKLYEIRQRRTQISQMYRVFRGVTLWILLIMAGSYLYKFDYSRIIVVLFYICTAIFVILGRFLVNKLYPYGFPKINVAIIGYGKSAKELAKRLKEYKSLDFNFVGFITEKREARTKALGSISNLRNIIKTHGVDEVYIADSELSREKVLNLVSTCFDVPTKFRITSNIFDLITGTVDIANIENIPSLDINKTYFSSWQVFYKRLFDVLFSFFALIITSPVITAIILAIKLDSSGKAVLLQERIGRDGKLFYMYKFRTMHHDSSLYKKSPRERDDKRVTRVGKFLRRTSLDELPQLVNVLKGEMSIVGPRPEMPFIVKKYKQWEKRRLVVKPGLTGLWQILGRKDLPLHKNLEYDFYYINNQSFILDLVIILKTIPVVIRGIGAY